MKNKIDELFKAKASQGNFTYKEAYWADAQKLLSNSPKGGGLSAGGMVTGVVALIVGASVALSFISVKTETQNATEKTFDINSAASNEKATPVVNVTTATPALSREKEPYNENTQTQYKSDLTSSDADTDLTYPSKKATQTSPLQNTKQQAQNAGNQGLTVEENSSATIAKTSTNNSVKAETTTRNITKTNSTNNQNLYQPKNDRNLAVANIEVGSSPFSAIEKTTSIDNDFELSEEKELVQINNAITKPFSPLENFTFNVGAEYGYFLTNRTLKSPSEDYTSFRNNFEDPKSLSNIGLNVQVGYRNWIFNTGIYQTKITEEINYPSSLMINTGVDNGSWNIDENWSYKVDSTWVIDSIYAGHWNMDTAWTVLYDSTYIAQWDSVKTEKETPELTKNNGPKTLTYVEIPLWFGRSFGNNKFAFDVQGGFALGFLTKTEGAKYINTKVSGLSEVGVEQYNRVLLTAMLRTGIRVEIMPRWEASLYPSLRYTLNSVQKNDAIKQRYFSYGVSLGLSYRF